jgi:hypothetical protein
MESSRRVHETLVSAKPSCSVPMASSRFLVSLASVDASSCHTLAKLAARFEGESPSRITMSPVLPLQGMDRQPNKCTYVAVT